jgi:hypothetical protein
VRRLGAILACLPNEVPSVPHQPSTVALTSARA